MAGTALVASHMASSAIQASMVYFSPLSAFFLLAEVVVVVVAASALWAVVRTSARIGGSARLGVARIACV